MKPPVASTTPRFARTASSPVSVRATTPTTRPSAASTSETPRAPAATRAPLAVSAASSFCIRKPPAAPSFWGWWPRGAGRASAANGCAASLPEKISPSSVGGSVPPSGWKLALNGTPCATSQWKCSTLRSQNSPIFAASGPGPQAAIRYWNIASGESSKPHCFCTGVPPPR